MYMFMSKLGYSNLPFTTNFEFYRLVTSLNSFAHAFNFLTTLTSLINQRPLIRASSNNRVSAVDAAKSLIHKRSKIKSSPHAVIMCDSAFCTAGFLDDIEKVPLVSSFLLIL